MYEASTLESMAPASSHSIKKEAAVTASQTVLSILPLIDTARSSLEALTVDTESHDTGGTRP
jgi:hypothetical protein